MPRSALIRWLKACLYIPNLHFWALLAEDWNDAVDALGDGAVLANADDEEHAPPASKAPRYDRFMVNTLYVFIVLQCNSCFLQSFSRLGFAGWKKPIVFQ
jgi:hypothetical protein